MSPRSEVGTIGVQPEICNRTSASLIAVARACGNDRGAARNLQLEGEFIDD